MNAIHFFDSSRSLPHRSPLQIFTAAEYYLLHLQILTYNSHFIFLRERPFCLVLSERKDQNDRLTRQVLTNTCTCTSKNVTLIGSNRKLYNSCDLIHDDYKNDCDKVKKVEIFILKHELITRLHFVCTSTK